MHSLNWDEYDFVECLGVMPEVDEFFTSHSYEFEKDGLILHMAVWQHESLIAVSLSQASNKKIFISLYFVVRREVKFVNEKESAFLSFRDCIVVPNRFWMNDSKDIYNKEMFASNLDIELCIHPQLEIKFE